VNYSLNEKKFNFRELALMETKIMYFPLVQSSLHSRSRNMLLDEYFEIDLHLHSFVEILNSLQTNETQLSSKFIIVSQES
jgi:hypothetical protein